MSVQYPTSGGGGAPSGPAGGDLGGTYPNPTVTQVNGATIPVSAKILGSNGSSQEIAAALTSTHIYVGSAGNLPVDVALSGDSTLTNAGVMANTGINGATVPVSASVLASNGSSQVTAAALTSGHLYVGSAGNLPVDVAISGDSTLSNAGVVVNTGINGATVPVSAKVLGSNGSSQTIAAALTSAHLYVGNGSNLPVDVAASGDVTLANTGAFTVAQVNGAVVPTSAVVVGSNASKQLIAATTTGSGTTAVLGTTPTFTTSIKTPAITVPSDSTTALQIFKADGSTNVVDIDTTNSRVGIGTTAPGATLNVAGTSAFGALNVSPGTATITVVDRTASTGATAVYIGSDNNAHTSAATTRLIVASGQGDTGQTSLSSSVAIQFTQAGGTLKGGIDPVNGNFFGNAFLDTGNGLAMNWNAVGNLAFRSTGYLSFTSAANYTSAADTSFGRTAAGVVSVGTGAQGSTAGQLVATILKTVATTVASLPGSPTEGMRASVTDSNAVSFTAGIGAVVAGGGSVHVPVYYDGTNWRIG